MKKSIHDGSVTYSVTVPNPAPGEGKHAKTTAQIFRRHMLNQIHKEFKKTLSIIRREK